MRNISTSILLFFGITLALSLIPGHLSIAAGNLTLSERTHKRLSVIHRLIDQQKYKDALKRLDALRGSIERRDYELALVLQTYGHIYAANDQAHQAIDSFEKCLALKAMPEPVEHGIRLNLAQLYMASENFSLAVRHFEQWLVKEKNPSAQSHALGAMLYAKIKSYPAAIKHVKAAIAKADKPREDWYQLLLAIYYERKAYKESATILQDLVAFFPKNKDYWKQLSNVYYLLNNDKKSLAVLELAYLKGLLTEEKEIINLANLYAYMSLSYKAANLLETAIKDARITINKNNLKLLSDCYFRAKELQKAEMVLARAAELSKDPELYLRIGQMQLDEENWPGAIQSIETAIAIGGLKQPGNAYLLQGIAFYEHKNYAKAMAAFKRAKQERKTREQARKWISFLSSRNVVVE